MPVAKFYGGAMRQHILLARPKRRSEIAHRVAHPIATPRTIIRSDIVLPTKRRTIERNYSPPSLGFQSNPYLDYGRYLTCEGGILMIFKDVDVRLRHTLWRLLAWTVFTGFEAIWLSLYASIQSMWIELAFLFALAVVNWLIVKKPVEIYRRIEIRPECMIVEDSDVFWIRYMEGGFPSFHADKDGNQKLSGIYGTRYVEYLTIRRFDENDRMSDVFKAHLQDAMRQLWSRPQ